MRHIHLQPPEKIPRDDEFNFRQRAKALVDKWQTIAEPNKENVEVKTNGAPNGTPKESEAITTEDKPAANDQSGEDKMQEDPQPESNANADAAPEAADVSMLGDVTMSEA